ncbi:hypothetical protein [Catenulispora subtropica]|uniref:hypothetical protein n=1 Tax=Catenulispora subtropica TaxID=450798 RepID=UPI0031D952EB
MIVTTGGEAELGAVAGTASPGPLEDEELCVTLAPPLEPAADFVPLLQAVVITAMTAAEAASRVIAGKRRFPPMGRAAVVGIGR